MFDLSVIVPFHDAGTWIKETIDSVAAQRGVAIELVLVDDGSSDNSAQLARRAAEGLHATLVQQSHSGVSRARNAGTAVARGAFLQYLDADDVLTPDTLRARLDALTTSGADVAYCDWTRWEQQKSGAFIETATIRRTIGNRPDIEILAGAWWPPGAVLYRRSIVDAIGTWREDLPIIQDARFFLDAALKGARFTHVKNAGLKYRSHLDSLSRRDPRAFLADCYRNGLDLQDQWDREGRLDAERRHTLAGLFAYVAQSTFPIDRNRFHEAIDRLSRLDPHYLPDGSATLKMVSRVAGYANAVRVATWYRQLNPLG